MFQAQLLIRGSADTVVYSPWFSRKGDYLRATVEVVAVSGATLTTEVFTKNKADTGDGSVIAGTSIAQTVVGRSDDEWTSLKEMVRYRFTCGTQSGQWVFFRVLPPVWFDAVKA